MFFKEVALKYIEKLIGKYLCQSLFFDKVAAPPVSNFNKNETQTLVLFVWILWNFKENTVFICKFWSDKTYGQCHFILEKIILYYDNSCARVAKTLLFL